MTITIRKAGALGLGLALVVGLGGIASADQLDWFSGGNTAAADPDRTSVPLKIYDASGAVVTTGSTSSPIGAFVAADGAVRAGDTYATAFLYRPDSGLAPGAWSGEQATGTTKSDAAHPASLDGKPFVVGNATGSLTVADFASAYPTSSSSGDFANVYELRLRTSSQRGGVSDAYASTFLKVSGSTWTVTTAPVPGGTPTTPPTTPAPTNPPPAPPVVKVAPAKVAVKVSKAPTSKKKGKAKVTVTGVSGRPKPTGRAVITFKKGGSTRKVTVTLSGGSKSFSVPKLKKGTWKVTVTYAGDGTYLSATSKTVTLKVKK